MINVLIVGCGGFIGSSLRYLVGLGVKRISDAHWFPWATLTVNVIGCFTIGIVGGLLVSKLNISEQMRLFVLVGILGGFTTFSSFGHETVHLVKDAQSLAALGNVLLHVVLCLSAAWFGHNLVR